jgi:hypothetical protein
VASLEKGGVEGSGPGDPGAATDAAPTPQRHGQMRLVADAVLGDLERVIHAYVARLRSDPATPSAHALPEADIEDHVATFLADLAGTLTSLDGTADDAAGALHDGTAIQRVVAERHGAQRARLGWGEAELKREYTILREELAAAIRRRAPAQLRGPSAESRAGEGERALEVLAQFLAVAERLSVASYRGAAGTPERSEAATS